MLESIKSSKKTIGIRQSMKAVENGLADTVYIAKDADEKVVRSIKELCSSSDIEIVYIDTMKQLGKACGIEVGAAVACVLK
ncbi:ribosomal L7Ae/L30e/S12e/Gadd45 family protein [Pseudobacteroides cellulosolvens]|uniref:Ribosomal protein L7Ae/L30e/S12e/Gadd45 n=1 Tax=Pseudobacteroides cellulosolvens ATCC 35603 = DSM 2933 TaxID=398512 RepID=A0A0L6JTX2_9FIRM|nr:ribosomal L7Ae/L30e/S12e/Gadd45 family protein [Pseudobacteroides cellulosolvens]KNY29130.1 ribosomal protein L7Ae/L30e/S12e/Gadd45 [Pseudobacteroides cellulosolvens ATCC 35603 = DSM 2933]